MAWLDLPSGKLFYAERKTSSTYPPVVCVHGAGGSHLDWPAELRRMSGVRLITLDLPGHGRSEGNGCDDTLEYARVVQAAMDALDVEQAIVLGHSMGGAIAQQMALHMSDHVMGLILIATGSKLPVDPTLPERVLAAPGNTIDWILDWAWEIIESDEMRQAARMRLLEQDPAVLRADYLACQAFDVRADLEAIVVPTLVIGATKDRMVPPKFSHTLHEHIPHASLVMIEGAGHMVPLERPQEVTRAILDWLEVQSW